MRFRHTLQALGFVLSIAALGLAFDWLTGLDPFRSQIGTGLGKGLGTLVLLVPIAFFADVVASVRAWRRAYLSARQARAARMPAAVASLVHRRD